MASRAMHQLLPLLTYIYLHCFTIISAAPLGFVDEGVANYPVAISAVMTLNPKPGVTNGKPMLLMARKDGMVDVVVDPDNSGVFTNVLNITTVVCTNGPRGIQSIVAHPDFVQFPYIYVYYTRFIKDCPANAITGPSNRLSRFTLNKASMKADPASELVLFETPPSANTLHDGGGLVIGSDMNIYLATGDGGQYEYPQNQRNGWGKLIRLKLDGTVPADNPYTATGTGKGVPCRNNRGVPLATAPSDGACEEIYSYGLRNPFRIDVDVRAPANEVRFSISDVGSRLWEEISYGGSKYKGRNYGWPEREGPCTRDTLDDCPAPTGNLLDPHYFYVHNSSVGAAVTGAVYVPTSIWPNVYKFLHVDFSEGAIYNLIEDTTIACRTCSPPRPGYRREKFHDYGKIVDIFFGEYKNTKALYYITRQSEDMTIRRIHYTGSTNNIPTATIAGLKPLYAVGETVNFVGSQSSDGDGDALTYLWKFGDGRTSTLMNPKIKYTSRGSYTVTLTVTDTVKQTNVDTKIAAVGEPPSAKMELPLPGTEFKVGDILRLRGSAFDNALNRSIVAPAQYFWEVRQHHETHFHPFLDLQSGNDFAISPAPLPEDFYAASNSYLQILMTVYDSDGISKTISRFVYPKKVSIALESEPSGMEVLLDGIVFTTPATVTTWQNQRFSLNADDQGKSIFASWSVGKNREVAYTVPTNIDTATITAYFRQSLRPTAAPIRTIRTMAPVKAPSSSLPFGSWFSQLWNTLRSFFANLFNFNSIFT